VARGFCDLICCQSIGPGRQTIPRIRGQMPLLAGCRARKRPTGSSGHSTARRAGFTQPAIRQHSVLWPQAYTIRGSKPAGQVQPGVRGLHDGLRTPGRAHRALTRTADRGLLASPQCPLSLQGGGDSDQGSIVLGSAKGHYSWSLSGGQGAPPSSTQQQTVLGGRLQRLHRATAFRVCREEGWRGGHEGCAWALGYRRG
jgi:hypothetical protein